MKKDSLWTRLKIEWFWRVRRHFQADDLRRRIAWWIPRKIALWVFVRVYACIGEVGPDYDRVYHTWERGGQ